MKKTVKEGHLSKYEFAIKVNTTPQNVGRRVALSKEKPGHIPTNEDGDVPISFVKKYKVFKVHPKK